MAKHPFLSPDWISETRKLREEYSSRINPPAAPPVRMNLVVTAVPFANGEVEAHLDTSGGKPEIDLGHIETPDTSVTVDYTTAKSVFVEGNMGAAMEAMQLGRIQIQGDMMKLMALATLNADAESIELARKIREITE